MNLFFLRLFFLKLFFLACLAIPLKAELRMHIPLKLPVGALSEILLWDENSIPECQLTIQDVQGKVLYRGKTFPLEPITIGDSDISFQLAVCFVSIDPLRKDSPVMVSLTSQHRLLATGFSQIKSRPWRETVMRLGKKNHEIATTKDPRKKQEAQEIWKIYQTFDPKATYAQGAFSLPLQTTHQSAFFGDKRRHIHPDGKVTFGNNHWAADFPCPEGTSVVSGARGRVVLAAERLATGNTVVVEHFPGVFSAYFHFKSLNVTVGQIVEKGTLLGLAGTTGFSTGPHVHWELRCLTVPFDGLTLVKTMPLDKKRIMAIISDIEKKGG